MEPLLCRGKPPHFLPRHPQTVLLPSNTSPQRIVAHNRGRSSKADSTLRSSQAVPHPSTNRALRRLTSEVGRDPVHSTRYGRQRNMLSRLNPRLLCRHRRSERKVLFASLAFVAHVGRSTHSIMAACISRRSVAERGGKKQHVAAQIKVAAATRSTPYMTVAILAQGILRAAAATQAFLLFSKGSSPQRGNMEDANDNTWQRK